MQFLTTLLPALLIASASATAIPATTQTQTLTLTPAADLECAQPLPPITLAVNQCGTANGRSFNSLSIPAKIPSSFATTCAIIVFDDDNCKAVSENVIAPALGAGRCIPTLFFGNLAGPEPAAALMIKCGPEE